MSQQFHLTLQVEVNRSTIPVDDPRTGPGQLFEVLEGIDEIPETPSNPAAVMRLR